VPDPTTPAEEAALVQQDTSDGDQVVDGVADAPQTADPYEGA
jgi:hypothetical protein